MKRYFKHDADIGFGPGTIYIEFDDETPTRQVEIYGDFWLSSLDDYHAGVGPGLADQSLSVMEFSPDDEISNSEFEEIWNEMLKRHQKQT